MIDYNYRFYVSYCETCSLRENVKQQLNVSLPRYYVEPCTGELTGAQRCLLVDSS